LQEYGVYKEIIEDLKKKRKNYPKVIEFPEGNIEGLTVYQIFVILSTANRTAFS
jgi:hypothetical protein